MDSALKAMMIDLMGGFAGDVQVEALRDRLRELPWNVAGHDADGLDGRRAERQRPDLFALPAAQAQHDLFEPGRGRQDPLAPDFQAAIRAERLDVRQSEKPRNADVVSDLGVQIEGKVRGIQGQAVLNEEAHALVQAAREPLRPAPENAVMNEEGVRPRFSC